MQRTPKSDSTTDKVLVRACEIANDDAELRLIEQEFDALPGEFLQAWNDAKEQG
jgi:hypothetical protein